MYGAIARLQVKPGSLQALQQWGSSRSGHSIPGYVTQYVFQMDNDPNELYLVVIFADKASYVANASSQVQHERFAEMRSMLAADPEWHDGEVIYAPELGHHGL